MSLKLQQAAFARLVTDDDFRLNATSNADAPAMIAELLEHRAGIESHALSLKRKRLIAARSRLRLTAMALADDFAPLFMRFAGLQTMRSDQRYVRDALAFVDWLTDDSVRDEYRNLRLKDRSIHTAIRFDREVVRAQLTRRLFRVLFVDGRRLPTGSGLPRRRFIAVWIRLRPEGRLWRWAMGIPFNREVDSGRGSDPGNVSRQQMSALSADYRDKGIDSTSTSA
ncbi:MAG: hypothetical protein H6819_01115 [Phycisphaerales bacterium]|nr:hypothetical protein [Phycisphaerales bacterium]MCB9857192.1 hypothetical protein [Phycisphaerales bacterium]MCB9863095.1 hypothetical protein [Phycisphaerales bacterium]